MCTNPPVCKALLIRTASLGSEKFGISAVQANAGCYTLSSKLSTSEIICPENWTRLYLKLKHTNGEYGLALNWRLSRSSASCFCLCICILIWCCSCWKTHTRLKGCTRVGVGGSHDLGLGLDPEAWFLLGECSDCTVHNVPAHPVAVPLLTSCLSNRKLHTSRRLSSYTWC